MPQFTPSSQHTATIVVKNTGNVPMPVWVFAQVVPGGSVGQAPRQTLAAGAQAPFVVALTMPSGAGTYQLGGEVHADLSAYGGQADQLMLQFSTLGEAVTVQAPANPAAAIVGVTWV